MSADPTTAASGRYQLIHRLAVGGMAEIWLGRQSGIAGFEKQIVIKRIMPARAADPEQLAMFLDEARLIGSLHHPNIVQVHDIGVDDGVTFYVMEHLEGADLTRIQEALERRAERMPLEHALLIAIGAAAGLHAAHEARDGAGRPLEIVHRDVSPGNVVVTVDGSVKLIDFGVAKAVGRRTVTRDGVVKGKVAFMSPEQLRCRPLDRRSDLFALGILLFELTTGTRLFDAPSDYEIMQQIVERPAPRPSQRVPGYPAALEAIVLRALAHRPEDRFPTAHDLVLALEAIAAELGLSLSPWSLGRYLRAVSDDDVEPLFASPGGARRAPRGSAPTPDELDAEVDTIDGPGGSATRPRTPVALPARDAELPCDATITALDRPALRRRAGSAAGPTRASSSGSPAHLRLVPRKGEDPR